MLIRTQLKLYSMIALVLLIAMIFSVIWSHLSVKTSMEKEALINDIRLTLFDRTVLRDDYLFMQSDRARKQWVEKAEVLGRRIAALEERISAPEHREIAAEIRRDHEASITIFRRMDEHLSVRTPFMTYPEAMQRLISQLLVRTHSLNRNIDFLYVQFEQEVAAAESIRTLTLAISMGIIATAMILHALFLGRVLAKRLHPLHAGLRAIGDGNLAHRLPEDGSDELSELAKSTNEMTGRLQETLTSNATLAREIADRKAAEDALRRSEEFLRAIIASSPLAIISIDPEGNVTSWNASAERMFGWTSPEVLGRPLPIIPADQSEDFSRLRERIAQGENVSGLESVRQKKDGGRIDVSISIAPIYGSEKRIIGNIGTLQDITEHKRSEAERRQLQELLFQAQKMEVVGRLAGGVAHDFNNALAIIFLSLEMLKMTLEENEPSREALTDLETAAVRARDVTRQLLAFSRKQMVSARPLDLNEQISGMHKSLVRLIGEDIGLQLRLLPEPCMIRIDPAQADQILINLALNARDAMPSGGILHMATSRLTLDHSDCRQIPDAIPGEYVQLTVSDTGSGIAPDVLPHIFEPFFTTKGIGQGTGLGLASIYGIIRQNNGFVEVESIVGQGTTFRIFFPLIAPAQESPQDVQEEPVRGSGTILLVEDEELLCKATRLSLELLGYTVSATCDPAEALRLIEEDHRDYMLLLSDIVMPGMSGCALQEKIAARLPGIRTLFMSGYPDDKGTCRACEELSTAWIQKPFSVPALSRAVRALLDQEPRKT